MKALLYLVLGVVFSLVFWGMSKILKKDGQETAAAVLKILAVVMAGAFTLLCLLQLVSSLLSEVQNLLG